MQSGSPDRKRRRKEEGKCLVGSHILWWLPDTPEEQQGALAQSKMKTFRKRPFPKRELEVLGM